MKKTNSLVFIALLMSVLFFTSCSKETVETPIDANLVNAIENANKQPIAASQLPAAALSVIEGEYANEFISVAQLAPKLGYKVIMRDEDAAHYENMSRLYFDLNGRDVSDIAHDRIRDLCFRIVFPISVTMHNGHVIEIANYHQLKRLIAACDGELDRVRDCFRFNFPITIVFGDRRIVVENMHQLKRAFARCDESDRPSDIPSDVPRG